MSNDIEEPTIKTEIKDFSNKKVLVVDDNNLNIKVATRLLKNYNIIPDTAINGEECINKTKEKTYDLILMDDMMPKMSGTMNTMTSFITNLLTIQRLMMNGKNIYMDTGIMKTNIHMIKYEFRIRLKESM